MTRKVIISLIFISIFFTTCRYKENPIFPSGTVKTRLQGTWDVVGLTSNGVDSLQFFKDSCGARLKINFYYQDGNPLGYNEIGLIGGKKGFNGTFSFSNNKKLMYVLLSAHGGHLNPGHDIIGPFGAGKSSKWKILKLTKEEFKITTDYNVRNYIISFKK